MRVDLVRDDASMLALLTAKDAGFYARENLDVLVTGKGRAQDASGPQLRLWHVGLADVILSNRVAQDLRLIALTSRRLTGVAASIILIEEKSDILIRFLRATIEGNFVALKDPALARKILARDTGIKGTRAIDASYRDFQAQSLPDMDISVADVQRALKAGKIGLAAERYVDGSLMAELRKSGFFETLQKKYGTP